MLSFKKLKNKNILIIFVFLLLITFLAASLPFFKRTLSGVMRLPLSALTSIKREISGIIFYHRNYIQNENIKKENDLLRQKLNLLNEIFLENKRLKELFSFKQEFGYKLIPAQVIGRSADNWSSLVIINKGTRHGIRQGMAAVSNLGLAGRVVESAEAISKVMLINDPNFSVSCLIQRNRQEGLVSGALGNILIMKYLPKDSDIKKQDVVVTSGLTGAYPKGLLVATVVEVNNELSGLVRYAILKPAVNLSSIEEVLIINQQ